MNRAQIQAEFAALPARPPLAFNPLLINAARNQTQTQITNNAQGHANPFGSNVTAAGYQFSAVGENVFARIPDVFFAHVGLNVDFGLNNLLSTDPNYISHRKAIMAIAPTPVYREAGIGLSAASGSNVSPNVITQSFGISLTEPTVPFLTGVAYRDRDLDGFYTAGEGLAGITVMPEDGTFFAVTSTSGGFAIPLKALTPGRTSLRVTYSGGPLTTPVVRDIALNGTNNVKADLQQAVVRLINLSTRLRVEPGDNAAIAGFVVSGTGPKKVLIRSLGPSLSGFGVAGALPDPRLELRDASGLVASNDSWKSTQQAEITATGSQPLNDAEPAIVATLNPGSYTAIVRGAGTSSGVAIVEVYDLNPPGDSFPINVSTRGQVQNDSNVMIGGFVVKGSKAKRVIVRAIGPTLGAFGVAGSLPDPTIELVSGGVTLATNDDWRSTQEAEIQASGFAPMDNKEAAIIRTLQPGSYTAIVRGKAGATGVGLFEVYDLD